MSFLVLESAGALVLLALAFFSLGALEQRRARRGAAERRDAQRRLERLASRRFRSPWR